MKLNLHPLTRELLFGSWWRLFIFLAATLAWCGTPLLLLRSAASGSLPLYGSMAGVLILGLIVFFTPQSWVINFKNMLATVRLPKLWVIIAGGIVARLLWVYFFPAQPASDGKTYLDLATRMLATGSFEAGQTKAYWPPGYPLFLIPWLVLFSPSVAVLLSQLTLYIIGSLGCYQLSKYLNTERSASMAALLLAIWPNLVTQAGIPAKEILITALLPWVVFLTLKPHLWANFFAGVLLGCSVLVQPSLQFIILGAALLIVLLHGIKHWPNAGILMLGAVLIISPWTVRNYNVFHQFVLISTNGGSNLYRANNPLADGGYTEKAAVDLSNLSELEADREAKKLAKEWIQDNPLQFGALMLEKVLRFMGDDSVGVYDTLKRGEASSNNLLYLLLKVFCNFWWLLSWLIMALMCRYVWKPVAHERLVWWLFLYLFLIHSIFESAGKYHVPVLWVLCIFIAGIITDSAADKKGTATE